MFFNYDSLYSAVLFLQPLFLHNICIICDNPDIRLYTLYVYIYTIIHT